MADKQEKAENMRLLHDTIIYCLTESERQHFIDILCQFQDGRDRRKFVLSLRRLLTTAGKQEVVPYLLAILPIREREHFLQLWMKTSNYNAFYEQDDRRDRTSVNSRNNSRNSAYSSPRGHNASSSYTNPYPVLQTKDRHASRNVYSQSLPLQTRPKQKSVTFKTNSLSGSTRSLTPQSTQSPRNNNSKTHFVSLKRDSKNQDFGFSIRGGSEHGLGIFISSVEEGSLAEKMNLSVGDQIVKLNEHNFQTIDHGTAVQLIQQSKKLKMLIFSSGVIPDSRQAHVEYQWVDVRGRPCSPPLNIGRNERRSNRGRSHGDVRLLQDENERRVILHVYRGSRLGLKIRGGWEYGLGIYVSSVDRNHVAEKSGIRVGDQILDVNGIDFSEINHRDAVRVLKSNKMMNIMLRDVRKIPYSRTVLEKTEWLDDKAISRSSSVMSLASNLGNSFPEKSMFRQGIAGSQLLHQSAVIAPFQRLIDVKARSLLADNEQKTLKYYLSEYGQEEIHVEGLVITLFHLLNTPEKMSLFSDIRCLIFPQDVDLFDRLVLEKDMDAVKENSMAGSPPQTWSPENRRILLHRERPAGMRKAHQEKESNGTEKFSQQNNGETLLSPSNNISMSMQSPPMVHEDVVTKHETYCTEDHPVIEDLSFEDDEEDVQNDSGMSFNNEQPFRPIEDSGFLDIQETSINRAMVGETTFEEKAKNGRLSENDGIVAEEIVPYKEAVFKESKDSQKAEKDDFNGKGHGKPMSTEPDPLGMSLMRNALLGFSNASYDEDNHDKDDDDGGDHDDDVSDLRLREKEIEKIVLTEIKADRNEMSVRPFGRGDDQRSTSGTNSLLVSKARNSNNDNSDDDDDNAYETIAARTHEERIEERKVLAEMAANEIDTSVGFRRDVDVQLNSGIESMQINGSKKSASAREIYKRGNSPNEPAVLPYDSEDYTAVHERDDIDGSCTAVSFANDRNTTPEQQEIPEVSLLDNYDNYDNGFVDDLEFEFEEEPEIAEDENEIFTPLKFAPIRMQDTPTKFAMGEAHRKSEDAQFENGLSKDVNFKNYNEFKPVSVAVTGSRRQRYDIADVEDQQPIASEVFKPAATRIRDVTVQRNMVDSLNNENKQSASDMELKNENKEVPSRMQSEDDNSLMRGHSSIELNYANDETRDTATILHLPDRNLPNRRFNIIDYETNNIENNDEFIHRETGLIRPSKKYNTDPTNRVYGVERDELSRPLSRFNQDTTNRMQGSEHENVPDLFRKTNQDTTYRVHEDERNQLLHPSRLNKDTTNRVHGNEHDNLSPPLRKTNQDMTNHVQDDERDNFLRPLRHVNPGTTNRVRENEHDTEYDHLKSTFNKLRSIFEFQRPEEPKSEYLSEIIKKNNNNNIGRKRINSDISSSKTETNINRKDDAEITEKKSDIDDKNDGSERKLLQHQTSIAESDLSSMDDFDFSSISPRIQDRLHYTTHDDKLENSSGYGSEEYFNFNDNKLINVQLEKYRPEIGITLEATQNGERGVQIKEILEGDQYAACRTKQLKRGQEVISVDGETLKGLGPFIAEITLKRNYNNPSGRYLHLVLKTK